MNTLFTNFELKAEAMEVAKKDLELAVVDIVSALQKEKGYVEFTDETSYPYFDDDTIGYDSIIAVSVKDGVLKLITSSQDVKPSEAEDIEWFYWFNYGRINFYELVCVLEKIAKKQ